jgi:hypothetical protein
MFPVDDQTGANEPRDEGAVDGRGLSDADIVLGGLPQVGGSPDGVVLDVDADPDADAGVRTRVTRPFRWWPPVLVVAVAGLLTWWAAGLVHAGLVDFGDSRVVSASPVIAAKGWADGTVEVVTSVPSTSCPVPSECPVNQVLVNQVNETTVGLMLARFASEGPVGRVDDVLKGGRQSDAVFESGRVVFRSPSGSRPKFIVDLVFGVVVPVEAGTGDPPSVPEVSVPAPG